ncbi:MAG: Hsp20/alpha crystallin family protein [Fuerstiella sp.]
MSEFRFRPLRLTLDIDRQIDRAFNEFINRPWGLVAPSDMWQPEIDIYETEDAYLIEADLPGVAPQNLKITVEEHAVILSGSRESTDIGHTAQGLSIERRQGVFSRRFSLDKAIDTETTEHECVEGLHRIRLGKRKNV